MNIFKALELPELFTFLLPGIIIGYLYQLTVVGNRWEYSRLILNCLVLATVYSVLIKPIFAVKSGVILPVYLHTALYLMAVPTVFGLIGIKLKEHDLLRTILGRMNIKLTHPIDTAWDYTFYETLGRGRYCIVTLKEGPKIYGFLGPASFIGSGNGNHDLMLENIYDVENNTWRPLNEPRSAYINGDDVMLIELLYDLEDEVENVEN